MGYMTNPIDLCWFMKLITHLAINWGCFFFSEKCVCKQQENGCDMLTKNNYGCFTQFFRTYSMLQHIFRETQVIGAYTTQIFMGFDLSL